MVHDLTKEESQNSQCGVNTYLYKLNLFEETNTMTNSKDTKEERPELEDEWLIRKCFIYDDEYSDCTSIKARFNQLFIYGKTVDCIQWKKDSINCYKFKDENDCTAGKELIESEKKRRRERIMSHYQNNVWTKRKEPPANWNAPLPESLQKDYENTYLNMKSKEMRGDIPPSFDPNIKFCTIL